MTSELQRMQAQLAAAARHFFEYEILPPFVLLFNPDDPSPHTNYASLSGEPPPGALSYTLGRMEARFRARGRAPRLEYLEDALPGLTAALVARGYQQEMQSLLMRCEPDEARPGPTPLGLRLGRLGPAAPLEHFHAFREVQWAAFGAHGATPGMEATEQFRARFADLWCYVAWQGEVPVGAGSLTPPHEGVAEVAGVATRPGYERRGIGSALTARIMRDAFDAGVDLLFLTAANAGAGRIYARLGFQPCGHGLAYSLPG